MTQIETLNDSDLILTFGQCVRTERKITADVAEFVREIDRRQLYLKEYVSLFEFLTIGYGYTGGAAQRRIDSARMLNEMPGLKKELVSGALNLSQVSMLAHGIRKVKKLRPGMTIRSEEKEKILLSLKNKTLKETELLLSQKLDLPIVKAEKETVQSDGSVRLEITFTREQMAKFIRLKEVISHSMACPEWNELFEYLAEECLKRKDPLVRKALPKKKEMTNKEAASNKKEVSIQKEASSKKVTSVTAVKPGAGKGAGTDTASGTERAAAPKPSKRTYIPIALKREIHQKYQFCQWKNPVTGKNLRLEVSVANGPSPFPMGWRGKWHREFSDLMLDP